MSELDESLKKFQVKYVPWTPGWEEAVENESVSRSAATVASATQQTFTETERELHKQGVKLVYGVKESKLIEEPNPLSILIEPASPVSPSHFSVTRICGTIETISLSREGSDKTLLSAQLQKIDDISIWNITSPIINLGECKLVSNSKMSSFYLIRNGYEEVAIQYKQTKQVHFSIFSVIIPALLRESSGHVLVNFEDNKSYLLQQAQSETVSSDCVKLVTREPQLKDGRYVLLFNGRVKRTSAKNFILTHESLPSREILLCGKNAPKQFVLDLNWPMSLLQGFGVFLTLFVQPKKVFSKFLSK